LIADQVEGTLSSPAWECVARPQQL